MYKQVINYYTNYINITHSTINVIINYTEISIYQLIAMTLLFIKHLKISKVRVECSPAV